ncbi:MULTISPECIES: MerR family transcriptional regulator [unclassified Crossiella]|uniref:helix-turn-helix domain-containing protein n=1 Tax=unclassified Crossiella TaxID=2620835 RepID=UPI001FFE8475|nr:MULTISPECIES: MerR family transcriptional regulator [unclassified Crossiella]MCK2241698.1 MerR family transcriptional regulator [Crossiella sp. S99.2]MCK2255430.1 MerR family transcriptional regulator [Crossiella sp. S99.1]
MLTISQLATAAGVTVRTVRHYHHIGLLPEPERDRSGYRRYSAQMAVDLIRIKTLADAGVPLARIDALLHAQPPEFAAAIADLDAELRRKIDQLAEDRRRIAALTSGEGLYLPPDMVANLDRARALGVSERAVRLERDTWVLFRALAPESLPEWLRQKTASFEDPDTVRLYLTATAALDWDPHDPRVDQLIDEMDAFEIARDRDTSRDGPLQLAFTLIAEQSPSWRRMLDVLAQRAEQRRAAAE